MLKQNNGSKESYSGKIFCVKRDSTSYHHTYICKKTIVIKVPEWAPVIKSSKEPSKLEKIKSYQHKWLNILSHIYTNRTRKWCRWRKRPPLCEKVGGREERESATTVTVKEWRGVDNWLSYCEDRSPRMHTCKDSLSFVSTTFRPV